MNKMDKDDVVRIIIGVVLSTALMVMIIAASEGACWRSLSKSASPKQIIKICETRIKYFQMIKEQAEIEVKYQNEE